MKRDNYCTLKIEAHVNGSLKIGQQELKFASIKEAKQYMMKYQDIYHYQGIFIIYRGNKVYGEYQYSKELHRMVGGR